jgi:hypothetical protein
MDRFRRVGRPLSHQQIFYVCWWVRWLVIVCSQGISGLVGYYLWMRVVIIVVIVCSARNGPVYAGIPYRNFFSPKFIPALTNMRYIHLPFFFSFFWRYILVSLSRSIPALLNFHFEHRWYGNNLLLRDFRLYGIIVLRAAMVTTLKEPFCFIYCLWKQCTETIDWPLTHGLLGTSTSMQLKKRCAIRMGTEIVPETSASFSLLRWLIAWEDFIKEFNTLTLGSFRY